MWVWPGGTKDVTIEHGMVISLNDVAGGGFQNAEQFQVTGWGPALIELDSTQTDYQGYDDRVYEFTITNTYFDSVENKVDFVWTTDTPEGGWGTGTATDGAVYELPDGVFLKFRNIGRTLDPATTIGSGCNRHSDVAPADKWEFAAENEDEIDWSLTENKTETYDTSSIILDRFGVITGTRLSYYIILQEVPQSITSVTDPDTTLPISYTYITGTNYLWFPAGHPGTRVEVAYVSRGLEPVPGQVYYISSQVVRPEEYYNRTILVQSEDQAQAFLAPNIIDENGNQQSLACLW